MTKIVDGAAMAAMRVALRTAIASLAGKPLRDRNRAHKFMVAASGAAGGALGLFSLPVELPVTTTLMLRAIADIARAEAKTSQIPRRRWPVSKSLHWTGARPAPMSRTPAISPFAACWRAGFGSGALCRQPGNYRRDRAGPVAAAGADRLAVRLCGGAEIPRPGDAGASARLAARRSMSPSSTISSRSPKAISRCGGWSANMAASCARRISAHRRRPDTRRNRLPGRMRGALCKSGDNSSPRYDV